MPELVEDFTPHPEEPSLPRKTRDEIVAQRLIRCAAGKLRQIAMVLRGIRHSLPEVYSAEEAEAMGEHRTPQALTYSIVGSLECILSDDLEPAIVALDEAGDLTPAELLEEWQERQHQAGEEV